MTQSAADPVSAYPSGEIDPVDAAPSLGDALRQAREISGRSLSQLSTETRVHPRFLGYAALEAADGAAGLKILQSDARIDLLVTDVGLPGGMNGRQMADAARLVRPNLEVLFITGYAENAVVGNGHLDPGMHVMTKPFAMEALASRIKALIPSG